MRIERAIDAFLDWRQLERDATPRSVESYRRVLDKFAASYPEAPLSTFDGREGTRLLRDFLASWVAESRLEPFPKPRSRALSSHSTCGVNCREGAWARPCGVRKFGPR
jgi:hypothetical protein